VGAGGAAVMDSEEESPAPPSSSSSASSSSSSAAATLSRAAAAALALELQEKAGEPALKRKDPKREIATAFLQLQLPRLAELYGRSVHPRFWDFGGLFRPYHDTQTTLYVLRVVFRGVGHAKELATFLDKPENHGRVDADVLAALKAGLKIAAETGALDSAPFSMAYPGLESGGRLESHESGKKQLVDRAMDQLAHADLGELAASYEMQQAASSAQTAAIARHFEVEHLRVKEVGEAVLSGLLKSHASSGGLAVGTAGQYRAPAAQQIVQEVKLVASLLLARLEDLVPSKEMTEAAQAIVNGAVPVIELMRDNAFALAEVDKRQLGADVSAGVAVSALNGEAGEHLRTPLLATPRPRSPTPPPRPLFPPLANPGATSPLRAAARLFFYVLVLKVRTAPAQARQHSGPASTWPAGPARGSPRASSWCRAGPRMCEARPAIGAAAQPPADLSGRPPVDSCGSPRLSFSAPFHNLRRPRHRQERLGAARLQGLHGRGRPRHARRRHGAWQAAGHERRLLPSGRELAQRERALLRAGLRRGQGRPPPLHRAQARGQAGR